MRKICLKQFNLKEAIAPLEIKTLLVVFAFGDPLDSSSLVMRLSLFSPLSHQQEAVLHSYYLLK